MSERRKGFDCLHVWRIPTDKRRKRFWTIGIYSDVDELNRWIDSMRSDDRWSEKRRQGRKYVGMCLSLENDPLPKNQGYIVFAANYLGSGLVVHEMTHAALRTCNFGYGRRLGRADEEQLALTIEWLTKEFWRKWYRYGEPKEKRWRRRKRRPRGPCIFTTRT